MRSPARRAPIRRPLLLAVLLAVSGLLLATPLPAHAESAGWGQLTLSGTSRDYSGTLVQQAQGFPEAAITSDSVGGGVGVQSGNSTYLTAATPPGDKYGSSQGQGYLNLRPNRQNGPPPSVTTYTFERPTPATGWTFVLGDVDADQVTVSATGADGQPVPPSALGFQSVFNYCGPGVCPANADVPTWNGTTGVLLGNTGALDTNGASAWFEPTVPLTSLTFTFAQRAGFPVYQTWFAALQYDLTGTITAPAGQADGITVLLFDPEGNQVGETTTNDDGAYAFEGYATYDGYRVQVERPTGLTSDQPLTRIVDLSEGNQVADFTLRAIVPTSVSGTVLDTDDNPVPGVTITLIDPDGGPDRTAITEADGSYVFEDVAVNDGYTLTATPPAGASVTGKLTVNVPADTEEPIEDQDFRVTFPPPPTPGSLTGTVTQQGGGPLSGVPVLIEGPEGVTFTVVTDEDGVWGATNLPPGDYTATVQPPEGTEVVGDASGTTTVPDGGGPADAVDFVLRLLPVPVAEYNAGGRVVDGDGIGVPGVEVTVTDPDGNALDPVTTDPEGAWFVPDLPEGQGYTAEVTDVPEGFQEPADPPSRSFDVVGEDETVPNFVLERVPTGAVSGTVTQDDGTTGISGVTIRVAGPGGSSFTATTDADGSWTVPDLPPGPYTATVVAPDGTEVVGQASRTFTIDDEGTDVADQDFVLAELPVFTAGGTVTDDSGTPLAGVEVVVTDPTNSVEQSVTTDENGAWTAQAVPPDTGYAAEVIVPDGYEPDGDTTLTFAVVDANVTGLDFILAVESGGSGSGGSGDSGSGSSGGLASTGGPSLLIGAGGVVLLLAGLLSVAYGIRRRRS